MLPLFPFIPKGALTHHRTEGPAVAALPMVGAARSPRGNATPAGASSPSHQCVMGCAVGSTVTGAKGRPDAQANRMGKPPPNDGTKEAAAFPSLRGDEGRRTGDEGR